jgi:iron complex transport system permease protein
MLTPFQINFFSKHFSIIVLFFVILIILTILYLSYQTTYLFTEAASLWVTLRLWPCLTAIFVGGLLAINGYLLQTITLNPLSEPYMLGLSGVASLGGLACLAFWSIHPAIGSMLLLMPCLWFLFNKQSTKNFLLKGLLLNALTGGLIAFTLQIASPDKVPNLLFWLLGDLSASSGIHVLILGLMSLSLMIWCFYKHRAFSLLWLGFAKAGMHIDLPKLQQVTLLWIALSTMCITLSVGSIGFVGLVVPHIIYKVCPRLQFKKHLLACFLLGAILLLSADFIAKYAMQPMQLPVGMITGLLGLPLIIYLNKRQVAN